MRSTSLVIFSSAHLLAFTGHRSPHRRQRPFLQRSIRSESPRVFASLSRALTICCRRCSSVMARSTARRHHLAGRRDMRESSDFRQQSLFRKLVWLFSLHVCVSSKITVLI